MDWQEIAGNWVLIPERPSGIIHFLGGAFVAGAPQLTYRWLLEELYQQHYAIIATPFINTLDHTAIARDALWSFEQALSRLQSTRLLRRSYLPIYGVGHSMGSKLHLLMGSLFDIERAGNILISFNNYPASRAIPLLEQMSSFVSVEFTPSPKQTNAIISQGYQVRRNLLIKFTNDDIDQTLSLKPILEAKYPGMVSLQTLNGSHVTPLGQDVSWRMGQVFSPVDALGLWFKQGVYRDLNQLKQEIGRWLNPMGKW